MLQMNNLICLHLNNSLSNFVCDGDVCYFYVSLVHEGFAVDRTWLRTSGAVPCGGRCESCGLPPTIWRTGGRLELLSVFVAAPCTNLHDS